MKFFNLYTAIWVTFFVLGFVNSQDSTQAVQESGNQVKDDQDMQANENQETTQSPQPQSCPTFIIRSRLNGSLIRWFPRLSNILSSTRRVFPVDGILWRRGAGSRLLAGRTFLAMDYIPSSLMRVRSILPRPTQRWVYLRRSGVWLNLGTRRVLTQVGIRVRALPFNGSQSQRWFVRRICVFSNNNQRLEQNGDLPEGSDDEGLDIGPPEGFDEGEFE